MLATIGKNLTAELVDSAIRVARGNEAIYLDADEAEELGAFISQCLECPHTTAAERLFDFKCNEADTRRESGEC